MSADYVCPLPRAYESSQHAVRLPLLAGALDAAVAAAEAALAAANASLNAGGPLVTTACMLFIVFGCICVTAYSGPSCSQVNSFWVLDGRNFFLHIPAEVEPCVRTHVMQNAQRGIA